MSRAAGIIAVIRKHLGTNFTAVDCAEIMANMAIRADTGILTERNRQLIAAILEVPE